MKYIKVIAIAALACIMAGSCSSDSDDQSGAVTLKETATGKPNWTIDLSYNEETPDWQAPDPSLYENWMIFMVRMQEELDPYISDDDMLALFIDGELRAVNHPAKPADELANTDDDGTFFILKVLGNEKPNQEVEATLKYWSSRFHQTFSVKGKGRFIPEHVKGVDTEFLPDIMLGSNKFPVTSWLTVAFAPEDYGLERSVDDLMGVFIGDECRGICRIYRNDRNTNEPRVIVMSKQEGEEARLLYYNAITNRVYDTGKTFRTVAEDVTISLN